ncbi:EndoU domain-containing protein [Nocardia sp. BMG111209]|uniref:EndoU domain-containing protein n=1 Tax=Nocardia sp. BMG111209 TaxID=1160137 RepID=UPI0003656C2F|nr:EndoU domain-containing protein [Nocardia sp. BMG111209]
MIRLTARVLFAVLAAVLLLSSSVSAQPPAIPQPTPSDVARIAPNNRNPAELSQRIAVFDAKANGFLGRAEALRNWEARLRTEESALQGRKAALDAEGNALEARRPSPYASSGAIAAFNTQIDAFNGKVSAYNTDVDNHRADVGRYNDETAALRALQQELSQEADAIDAELARVEAEAQRASRPRPTAPQPGNQAQRQAPTGVDTSPVPVSGNAASRQQQAAALRKYAQDKSIQLVERPVTSRLTADTLSHMSEQEVAALTGGGQREFDALARRADGTYVGVVVRRSSGVDPSEAAFDASISRGGQAETTLDGAAITITGVDLIDPVANDGGTPAPPVPGSSTAPTASAAPPTTATPDTEQADTPTTGGPNSTGGTLWGVVPGGPPNITITQRDRIHILDGHGDGINGGHAPGTGMPNKTEFPDDWEDDEIIDRIVDVARNPDHPPELQKNGRWLVKGRRNGVDIEVVVLPGGRVWTGYPTGGQGVIHNDEHGNPK